MVDTHADGTRWIRNDRVFPIYSFSAIWEEDVPKDTTDETRASQWFQGSIAGLPEGRRRNSTAGDRGFKGPLTVEDIETEKAAYVARLFESEKIAAANPSNGVAKIELRWWESWWLTWFEHVTFDLGQSNDEALLSFEWHVDRITRRNQEHGLDWEGRDLMGAEDRWRWHGSEPDGKPDTRSDPPCRCKFCKAAGLIKIGH